MLCLLLQRIFIFLCFPCSYTVTEHCRGEEHESEAVLSEEERELKHKQNECAVHHCTRYASSQSTVLSLAGSWALKDNATQTSHICSGCYANQSRITGHPSATQRRARAEYSHLMKSAKVIVRKCAKCGDLVLLSRDVNCWRHTLTMKLSNVGDIDVRVPCNAYCHQQLHMKAQTVTAESTGSMHIHAQIFVCLHCADYYEYFTCKLRTDVESALATPIATFYKSPGLVAAISRHVEAMANSDQKGDCCIGITNKYALKWYLYHVLTKEPEKQRKDIVMFRIQDVSAIFSISCQRQRVPQSERCTACNLLWHAGGLRQTAQQTEQWEKQPQVKPKTKISILNNEQLKGELAIACANLYAAISQNMELVSKLKQFQEAPKFQGNVPITPQTLELVIDHASEVGVLQPSSPLHSILMATVQNLRKQEAQIEKDEDCQASKKGFRYSPQVIKIAAWLVHKCREKGYTAIASLVPGLPSWETVRKFRNNMSVVQKDHNASISPDFLIRLFEQMKLVKSEWIGGIHWDEMVIKEGLVVCQRTGQIVGFEDTESFEEEFESMSNELDISSTPPPNLPTVAEALIDNLYDGHTLVESIEEEDDPYCHYTGSKRVAKQILEFFWSSISGDFSTHLATFPVTRFSSGLIQKCLKHVLSAVETCSSRAGVSILTKYVTCDGASYSDAFFRCAGQSDWVIPHPIYPTQHLWVISDPPHLMKKLRNNLLDTTRELTVVLDYDIHCPNKRLIETEKVKLDEIRSKGMEPKDQEHQTDEPLPDFNEQQPGNHRTEEMKLYSRYYLSTIALSGGTIIGPKHVELTSKTKMNVKRAVQILSGSVARACWSHYFTRVGKSPVNPYPGPLCSYLIAAEEMFAIMNAHSLPAPAQITKLNSWVRKLLQCLLFFTKWKHSLEEHGLNLKKAFITLQTYSHLKCTIRGAIGLFNELQLQHPGVAICPRSVNQDDVENYFSLLRERIPGAHPTLAQVQQITPSINFNLQVAWAARMKAGPCGASYEVTRPAALLQPSYEVVPNRHQIDRPPTPTEASPSPQNLEGFVPVQLQLTKKEEFDLFQHLQSALVEGRNRLCSSVSTPEMVQYLSQFQEVITKHNVELQNIWSYVADHAKRYFFNPKNYSLIRVGMVATVYLTSEQFIQFCWTATSFAHLAGQAGPPVEFIQKFSKHFFHRRLVYCLMLDGFSPSEQQQMPIRQKVVLSQKRDKEAYNVGRKYGDQCLRCGEEGHWAMDCPNPVPDSHLQTIQCFKCGAKGHFQRNCTEIIDHVILNYKFSNLRNVLEMLPVRRLENCKSFLSFMQNPSPLGIEQRTQAWHQQRRGMITGSMAYFALIRDTKKCSQKDISHYYEHLAGDPTKTVEDLYNPSRRTPSKQKISTLPKEYALKWGQLHERSGVLTLLQNYTESVSTAPRGHFIEVGMLKVSDGLFSPPDGIFMTEIDDEMIAVEVKASWFNGRGFPRQIVPWNHFVQTSLEIIALGPSAKTAWYVSWSPVGTNIFEVKRDDEFCVNLVHYLSTFYENAALKHLPFSSHMEKWGPEALNLGQAAVRLSRNCTLLTRTGSIVDGSAKENQELKQIVDKADHWHLGKRKVHKGINNSTQHIINCLQVSSNRWTAKLAPLFIYLFEIQ